MQLYQHFGFLIPNQSRKNRFLCNGQTAYIVSRKTPAVKLYPLFAFCLLAIVSFSSCRKDKKSSTEEELYGTWVNQNAPGDTIIFLNKNNKNIVSVNLSFNPTLAVRKEMEYTFKDSRLDINTSPVSSAPLQQISSFTWIEKGKRFEIKGFQLYLFMSSSVTKFVYLKVN